MRISVWDRQLVMVGRVRPCRHSGTFSESSHGDGKRHSIRTSDPDHFFRDAGYKMAIEVKHAVMALDQLKVSYKL